MDIEIVRELIETGGPTAAMIILSVIIYAAIRFALPAMKSIAVMYENAMAAQTNVLQLQQRQIDACTDATKDQRVRMDKLEDDVAQKAGRIAELEKQVVKLKEENATLREELAKKEKEMDAALKAKDNEIDELQKRVDELEHPAPAKKGKAA